MNKTEIEAKGTIVITDPCYVINDSNKTDDWRKCKCGDDMGVLGFTDYISKSTLEGDWGCTTFDVGHTDYRKVISDAKANKFKESDYKPLGDFCADSGMVCVLKLDECLKYNPNFNEWIDKHSWCVTVIRDFEGTVKYYIDPKNENYEYDTAHIIGLGNVNFVTL